MTGADGLTGRVHAPTHDVPVHDVRPSVLRNMAHMMSSQAVSWILGTVAQIVQPRFLGPEGLGQLRLAFSLWMIAQVFASLGTSMYLTLEMARDRQRGAALVGPVLLLRLGAFSVASVVMAAYAMLAGFGGQMMVVLAIAGSTMLVTTIADTFAAALVGLERMKYPAISFVAGKAVYTVVMVTVLLAGGGVVGVAATTIVNATLVLVLMAHFYRRFGTITWARPAGGYGLIVRSSSGFLAAGAIIIVYLQVDTVVISILVDERTLGWYATADVLASSMMFVPTIMMATLFPVIGRLHAADVAATADLVRRVFSALFLAGVAVGFGLFVVAEPLSVLLFGEEFRETGPVLGIMGLTMPLLFGTLALGTVAMATGRQRFWNTLMLAAIGMSIGLDVVLVPLMVRLADNGAIGGAMSYMVTEAFMLGVGLACLAPLTFAGASLMRIVKILGVGAVMVLTVWPMRDAFILVPVVVGAAVFVGGVLALGVLTPEERQMSRRLLARFDRAAAATARSSHGDATNAGFVDESELIHETEEGRT